MKKRIISLRRLRFIFCIIMLMPLVYFSGCSRERQAQKPAPLEQKSEGGRKEFTLMISPCGKRAMTFTKYKSFQHYLAESTGFTIKLVIPRNFKEFIEKAINQEVDFVFMDPTLYFEVRNEVNKKYLYTSLCGFIDEYKGKPLETGCIITRADSNIKSIKEVKGKRVIFGPQNSATKWIAAKALFIKNGIDLEKDLAGYSFGGSCMDIVYDIYHKKAEVGCVRTLMCPLCQWSELYGKLGIDISQLAHCGHTAPVMTWIFAGNTQIDEKVMRKIGDSLLKIYELDSNKKELFAKDIKYGFVKVEETDFDDLKNMMMLSEKFQ